MVARNEIIINEHYAGFNPVQFGSENCEPGHSFGPSIRTHWLLHYVVQGFGKFVRDGITWEIGPGEVFVIPPYEETYYEADKDKPWRYIWVGFTVDGTMPPVMTVPVLHCARAGRLFEEMLRCNKWGNGRSAFLSCKLWELYAALLEEGEIGEDYINKALHYMNVEYVNDITIQQVAEMVNLDRSYFSTLFKAEMGISPQKYLIHLRLKKAAELLTVYGESPTMAGISVGYPDLYHFSKIFKQYFGCSPREYRSRYLRKEIEHE